MTTAPSIPTGWLVRLVNEYGTRPRGMAGETDEPYPDLAHLTESPAVDRLGTTDLVALADRLWPVFAAPSSEDKAGALNELLAHSGLVPIVDPDAQIRWSTPHRAWADILTAGCAISLFDVVRTGGWQGVGACDGQDCVDVYLDTSGRSRRYCSTTCLNRARIRAYRARRRA